MHKLLFLLLLLPSLAFSQVDIQIARPDQTFLVAARNATWGVSGGGAGDCSVTVCGANNNFIFPTLYQSETIYITVFNNSTATTEQPQIRIATANDPAVTQFQNNQARWSTSFILNISPSQNTVLTIPPLTSATFSYQTTGATRAAILISNSTVAVGGGADFTITQVPNFVSVSDPCQSSAVLKQSSTLNVTTTQQLIAGRAGTKIYICAYDVNFGSTVTVTVFKFVQGTGTNCGTGTADMAVFQAGATTAFGNRIANAGLALVTTDTGVSLCAGTLNGTGPQATGSFTFVQQ